jgi:hypothetical protein
VRPEGARGAAADGERGAVMTTKTVVRFGEIARRLGYVRAKDIEEALEIQRRRAERGESHKLLGLILLEQGSIDTEQLIEILKQY